MNTKAFEQFDVMTEAGFLVAGPAGAAALGGATALRVCR